MKQLAESSQRPKTGYRDNFVCGDHRAGCKAAGRTPQQCYEVHDPEDTQHSQGDVMRAHTTDQSILETN